MVLNRTTLGYEVRAVGFNPEAARYGGISVKRSIIASMAICGAFAGLAGAVPGARRQLLDRVLRRARRSTSASPASPSRCSVATPAIGVVLAALLFAALQSGGRQLSGSFSPELASGVSSIIQGTIILLVGGELIVRWLVARAKRERVSCRTLPGGASPPAAAPSAGRG